MSGPGALGHVTGWTVIGSYSPGVWCRLGRPHGTERSALAAAMDERRRDRDLARVGVVTPLGTVLMMRFEGVKVGLSETGRAS